MWQPRTPLAKKTYSNKYYYGGNSSIVQSSTQQRVKRQNICYICKDELLEEEKDFYPCNCKYQICHQCYFLQVEKKNRKCPNCDKLYEVQKVNEYINKQKQSKQDSHQNESESSSIISGNSQKQLAYIPRNLEKRVTTTPQKRTSSDNQRSLPVVKLSQIRILQKNTIYVIGVSPTIAKDEILKRYEYFGQYGKILQVTINKENIYQSENQGPCYSAYITYTNPKESSLAILAIDQFYYDNRLMRASFGRTKYCKFFLKQTQCLNKECPYQHFYSEEGDILTQEDMHKKQLFQQCQQLAFQLSMINEFTEEQYRKQLKQIREQNFPGITTKPILPSPESIYEKKQLFKIYAHLCNSNQIRQVRKLTTGEQLQYQKTKELDEQALSKINKKSHSRERNAPKMSSAEFQKLEVIRTKTEEKVRNGSHKGRMGDSSERKNKRKNSQNQQSINETSNRIQSLEQQLAFSLQKQLGPQKEDIGQELISTDQTMSIFNEKKNSRFLSLKDDEDGRDPLRERILLSRNGSVGKGLQKKASMQSLILESFKFLNDDNDVPEQQKKYDQIIFNTNPPSEVHNLIDNTPVPSQLGEIDENYIWNHTITSLQDYNQYSQAENISCISHQERYFINQRNKNDFQNSLYTSSHFLINSQNDTYSRPSNLTDLNFKASFTSIQQKDIIESLGRRNTSNFMFGPTQHNSSIDAYQLNRCPSQPNYDQAQINALQKAGIKDQNIRQRIKDLQIQQQNSNPLQFSTIAQEIQSQGNRMHSQSYDKQGPFPLNQQNLNLFDKQFDSSKDILYAKIFLQQDGVPSSNNIISSQSLFCYNPGFDEEIQRDSTIKTPIKDRYSLIDHQEIMSTQPKNYYKEFLSVKESFLSNSMSIKRRNSLDLGTREVSDFEPQQLQFLTPCKGVADLQMFQQNQQKKSKSRSNSRKNRA